MGIRQRSHDYINSLELSVGVLAGDVLALLGMGIVVDHSVKMVVEDVISVLQHIWSLGDHDEKQRYEPILEKLYPYMEE